MKVIELIKELRNYPPDVEVVIDNGECENLNDNDNVYEINDIEGQSEYKYGDIKRVLIK